MASGNTYCLVTNSDERLFPKNKSIIFLGNWCLDYHKQKKWEKLDYIVAKPYILNQSDKDDIFNKARKLENKLFPELCSKLNQIHSLNNNNRFWKILLGHWFRFFIDLITNRVNSIYHCLERYNISEVSVFNHFNYSLTTKDFFSAVWACNDDEWNSNLYSFIFEIINFKDIKLKKINNNLSKGSFEIIESKKNNHDATKTILERFKELSCKIYKSTDGFIINSFLPILSEMKLHLATGQFPKRRSSKGYVINDIKSQSLRKNFSLDQDHLNDNLELVARKLLFELLPICYLEGFANLNKQVELLNWPHSPQFIFTSNNYSFDELFKLWSANKIKKGSKYIIGQHGNNPGIDRYMQNTIEMEISDRYLTWGWENKQKNVIPAFIFKTVGVSRNRTSHKNGILLVLCHYPHQKSLWDETFNYHKHFYNLISLIEGLVKEIRKEITVRLHSASRNLNYYEKDRLLNFDKNIKISDEAIPFNKQLNKNKLIIFGYDSTGAIEMFSRNIPTLVFFGENLEHLRDDAKDFYNLLVKVKIIHFSHESLTKHLNAIWSDIDKWWFSNNVQIAISKFCFKYANRSKSPISDLVSLLNFDKEIK